MNKGALAVNIRIRLVYKEMTIKRLAEIVNVSYREMLRYCKGERFPTAFQLYDMAKVLGCTMDDLMEGVEEQ